MQNETSYNETSYNEICHNEIYKCKETHPNISKLWISFSSESSLYSCF